MQWLAISTSPRGPDRLINYFDLASYATVDGIEGTTVRGQLRFGSLVFRLIIFSPAINARFYIAMWILILGSRTIVPLSLSSSNGGVVGKNRLYPTYEGVLIQSHPEAQERELGAIPHLRFGLGWQDFD